MDTTLAVYTASAVNTLTEVASNDDYVQPDCLHQGQVSFPTTAATTYYIAVDGFSTEEGAFDLSWGHPTLPAPDADGDGEPNATDQCPDTPAEETANADGCSPSQLIDYVFMGFAHPINNGVVNGAKAGQVVPVKWNLMEDGVPVSDPASFVSTTSQSGQGECAGQPSDAIETHVNNGGLKYLGDGNWQFNWATPKSYAGQCRVMQLMLSDGSSYTAAFRFR